MLDDFRIIAECTEDIKEDEILIISYYSLYDSKNLDFNSVYVYKL